MARPGQELENPATGQRIVFRQTADTTGGELLEMEAWYRAGGPPAPLHYHPVQDERFEVLEGAVRCVVGREERILRKGEVIEIPAGQVHEFGGDPEEDGHVRWETRPALRTEEFFEAGFGLAEAGKVNPRTGIPGLLQVAPLAREYSTEFRLASPPWPVQRLALAVLAPLGRLLRR
jgi:quercetin dioxygenase-like cupin family protein